MNPSLGIGVITRNRRDCALTVIAAIEEHTTTAYNLVAGVDHSDDDTAAVLTTRGYTVVEPAGRGIPANRNAVLAALYGHDVVILIEDDHRPVATGWERPYIDVVTRTPVQVCFGLGSQHGPLTTRDYAGTTVGWRPNMGCVLVAMHRNVLDMVGGWDPAFGDRYGLDDGTWAIRCRRAGLAGNVDGFPCLPCELESTADIPDPPSSDGKTIEQRQADIAANWPLWERRFSSPVFIPLST